MTTLETINNINLYDFFLKMAKDMWYLREYQKAATSKNYEIQPFIFNEIELKDD
ncbi:hypothetical protein [Campylobacter gastrosuis]|uniref:Uncharacterized protein n=1 Tax=Campylobacter gastrosuis TaxID=2974576 RepID=A0ABT7HT13_9BACT|nr:hypothetical protein [Campylobacter gastrosuis]MDL0090040.1 hypothetical protein [Campylobacter gastrosuis]